LRLRRFTVIIAADFAEILVAYIHQDAKWPNFTWDSAEVLSLLASVRHRQGRLFGRMESLGFELREEAVLRTLTEDVTKSSEIEGEVLDKEQVRSSIARRLGMDVGAVLPADRNVEGVVEMMLDATQRFREPLTADRLFGWHAALFPTGRSGMIRIAVGAWRGEAAGPMQVVSGRAGRERVHFEAPSWDRLAAEMEAFLAWFERKDQIDPVLRAAIAHLWFVTIHPFEDGNGRIARAIADMALSRSEGSPQRFYSMSAQIRVERKGYYDILEETQKGELDVTAWLVWFLHCLDRAFDGAEMTLSNVLTKASVWDAIGPQAINERQRKILNLLLDGGFEGKLTARKWGLLTKTSVDTGLRDINDLIERGILVRDEMKARATSYSLVLPEAR
jgi:Fic family protein